MNDEKPVILLDWYGFRENLVADIDSLVAYAEDQALLDHAIIIDATRSRGGSRGPYAVQRLSPKPFKTTFGNLRLSDVTEAFVAERRSFHKAGAISDSGDTARPSSGRWRCSSAVCGARRW